MKITLADCYAEEGLIMRISNLKKNLLTCFKIICIFFREDQNVPKPLTRAPNQIPLSINRLELSPLSFSHTFLKRLKLV